MRTSVKALATGLIAIAGLASLAPGAVARERINWSISIGEPSAPNHAYNQAYPVYVQPRPVYVQPPPVYLQPQPVYVGPAPALQYHPQYANPYRQQYYVKERHHHRHWKHDRPHYRHGYRD